MTCTNVLIIQKFNHAAERELTACLDFERRKEQCELLDECHMHTQHVSILSIAIPYHTILFFFFNYTAPTEIYPLPLPAPLPIFSRKRRGAARGSGAPLSTEAAGSRSVSAPASRAVVEAKAGAGAACCTSVDTPAATKGASRRLKGRGHSHGLGSHALAQPRGLARAAEGAGSGRSGGRAGPPPAVPQGRASA